MSDVIYEQNINTRNRVMDKLKGIIKQGHLPTRGYEKYKEHWLANCFEHAVFNLTNEELKDFNDDEKMVFRLFHPTQEGIKTLFNFVEESGLLIQPCKPNAILKSNQWKVAFYLHEKSPLMNGDWHWILQMPDGNWTEKSGTNEMNKRRSTPRILFRGLGFYKRIGYYQITNNYAQADESGAEEEHTI